MTTLVPGLQFQSFVKPPRAIYPSSQWNVLLPAQQSRVCADARTHHGRSQLRGHYQELTTSQLKTIRAPGPGSSQRHGTLPQGRNPPRIQRLFECGCTGLTPWQYSPCPCSWLSSGVRQTPFLLEQWPTQTLPPQHRAIGKQLPGPMDPRNSAAPNSAASLTGLELPLFLH